MKILLVCATLHEIAPTVEYLKASFDSEDGVIFQGKKIIIHIFITGVGLPLTAYKLGKILASKQYDYAINVGLAGSFSKNHQIGKVVNIISERFADLGVEEANATFTDVFELGLFNTDEFPFENGILHNHRVSETFILPIVHGISVNKVHGTENSIEKVQKKYHPDVESMEGAAFFYACLDHRIPFLEIRAISNFVEPRNKENWNIPLAIKNLNRMLIIIIESFEL